MGTVELAAATAVGLAAAALILMIWMMTARTIAEQNATVHDTAERLIAGQAANLAEAIGQELLMIDQSLTILQTAWKLDSDAVNLSAWKQNMPALTAVANDLFVADDKHIIRQDTLPKAVVQGIGSGYVSFPHGALERLDSEANTEQESVILQMNAGQPVEAREYLMYVVRPLDHPAGWLVGASYRSAELVRMFARASLGYNAVVALVDTRLGVLQAVAGPAARRPRTNLNGTPMYQALLRGDAGTWEGMTAIDDVERIHAFHTIAGRDMAVVVAASETETMSPALGLAAATRLVASVGTALVLVVAGLVGYGLYTWRATQRRRKRAARHAVELTRLRADEEIHLTRLHVQTMRLQALLDHGSDGVALVDAGLQVTQWNSRFARGIGVPLEKNLPLDELIRRQAGCGVIEPGPEPEDEIARRIGCLRQGGQSLPQKGPDGALVFLHGVPVPGGGSILILSGLAELSAAAPITPAALPVVNQPAAPSPIEW